MSRKLFSFVVSLGCLATAGPVALAADDNVIRIIREDGTVTEYDLPQDAVNAPVSPAPVSPSPVSPSVIKPEQPVPPPSEEKAQSAPPTAADTGAGSEAAGVSDKKSPDVVTDRPEEAAQTPELDPKPKPKPKKQAKPAASAKHEIAPAVLIPLPGRKPPLPYHLTKPSGPEKDNAGYITRDAALRIALAAAPPARRFEVTPVTYRDFPAYRVTFVTDEGVSEIFVDAVDGRILK